MGVPESCVGRGSRGVEATVARKVGRGKRARSARHGASESAGQTLLSCHDSHRPASIRPISPLFSPKLIYPNGQSVE